MRRFVGRLEHLPEPDLYSARDPRLAPYLYLQALRTVLLRKTLVPAVLQRMTSNRPSGALPNIAIFLLPVALLPETFRPPAACTPATGFHTTPLHLLFPSQLLCGVLPTTNTPLFTYVAFGSTFRRRRPRLPPDFLNAVAACSAPTARFCLFAAARLRYRYRADTAVWFFLLLAGRRQPFGLAILQYPGVQAYAFLPHTFLCSLSSCPVPHHTLTCLFLDRCAQQRRRLRRYLHL